MGFSSFHYSQFFQSVILSLWIVLWGLLPETKEMVEDPILEYRNFLRFNDVLDRGRRVFLARQDSATCVVQGSGGRGTSNNMPWRDKD